MHVLIPIVAALVAGVRCHSTLEVAFEPDAIGGAVVADDTIADTVPSKLTSRTVRSLVRRQESSATLIEQEDRLSSVSARWGGKVIYAIFTSSFPKYHDAMLAQLDTWAAKPYAEGRLVAMGGSNYPPEWQRPGTVADSIILPSKCPDKGGNALACKESALIVEAASRGAAWVVLLGEDNWMNASGLDAYLQARTPDEPEALGLLGCGRFKKTFCAEVEKDGGFCGGGTYAINRAALQRLVATGASNFTAEYTRTSWPNDMTTSCALMRRGVPLRLLPHLHGSREVVDAELAHLAKGRFSLHNIDEATMRWLHAYTSGKDAAEVSRLHEAAFHEGCVRSANNTQMKEIAQQFLACLNRSHHKPL
eukprot:TRINITY_DN10028_c0_g1_i2.p1 TRINITY_DN10028_c0_g1~~TRINITY_DN10028_c0_g1_i2.p1  ORF type:complete len:364 (+),score=76.39 TRINITY_DN10028_c0_g1_i2:99-1190(+)